MRESRVAVLVRMRAGLKARLVELAKREHRSLNQQIEFLLENCVGEAREPSSHVQENGKTPLKRKK
jgi:hypothetical protein